MLTWLYIYHRLLDLALGVLTKSRSIPEDPSVELGLDLSRPIIYILPHSSRIDLLILRKKCLEHNLPDPLKPLSINNMELPCHIFLQKNRNMFTHLDVLKEKSIELFNKYLDLHFKNSNLDVQIVPVFIIFRFCPSYDRKNLIPLNIINYAKRIIEIVRFSRDIFVCFSNSLSLREIAKKYSKDIITTKKLVRMACIYFSRQRLAIIGSPLLSRRNLLNRLLTSKVIARAIEDEIQRKKISYNAAKKNILLLIEEITANFSYKMIRLANLVLKLIWNHLYQGINTHNIERIRQLAYNGHEIVYIPCHRSHMDYVLLSYVLYQQGLIPPHIAAGINLNFWPIGSIFRRLGAFFIRRTFAKNKLYSLVFREYLRELFIRGHSVEFFIEGGRSRTGRLLNPKTGTLSMTIQAVLRSRVRPIALIPVYIGYEHIMEVNTYNKELRGATKEKENLLQALLSLKKLRNLGYSYINFGEPLLLTNWLNQHIPDWRRSTIHPIKSIRPVWMTSVINNIATDLMVRINNAGAMNAVNLCCTALLASRYLSLTREQLTEQLNCYLDLMRNVPYSDYSTIPLMNADMIIDHALQMKQFGVKNEASNENNVNEVIILSREQAALSTYYRNNISHMLILPSLIATIISKYCYISPQKLLYYVSILYPMLKAELFLRWERNKLSIELNKITNELLRQRLILLKGNKFQINPSRYCILKLLANSACETLQRYAITFWLLSIHSYVERNSLEKWSQVLAKRLALIHGINAPEFFDKSIFSTLILTLRNEGYINDFGNSEKEEIMKIYLILAELITSDVRSTIENTNSYKEDISCKDKNITERSRR